MRIEEIELFYCPWDEGIRNKTENGNGGFLNKLPVRMTTILLFQTISRSLEYCTCYSGLHGPIRSKLKLRQSKKSKKIGWKWQKESRVVRNFKLTAFWVDCKWTWFPKICKELHLTGLIKIHPVWGLFQQFWEPSCHQNI